MRAIYYDTFKGPISIESLPDPSPTENSVVISVKASGLCRSDWHGWMGHDPDIVLPHVPGHELAGEIVEIGKGIKNWKAGDRVTVPFVSGCGDCSQCEEGQQQVCDHQFQPGFTAWGSFAEYVRIDYADLNLVQLPESVNYVVAASLGCRFITSWRAVIAQGQLKLGQWVAVYGCGGVGLSAIMIAKAHGAQVLAIDIKDDALEMAKSLGADVCINASETTKPWQAVNDHTHGGAHISLDALGSASTCFQSIRSLRKRGKHIQVGLMAGDDFQPRIPMEWVIAHELEILGSHGMQAHAYGPMMKLIEAGKIQPEQLLGGTLSLEEAAKLLPKMNTFPGKGVMVVEF